MKEHPDFYSEPIDAVFKVLGGRMREKIINIEILGSYNGMG